MDENGLLFGGNEYSWEQNKRETNVLSRVLDFCKL